MSTGRKTFANHLIDKEPLFKIGKDPKFSVVKKPQGKHPEYVIFHRPYTSEMGR